MIKKITLLSALAILVISIASFVSHNNFAFSEGNGSQGDGYSGSPGDGNISCATGGCHSGATTITGWITSDVPGTGYVPSTAYTITCTMVGSTHGFEITSEKSGGTKVGTFSSTSGMTLYNSNHALVSNQNFSSKTLSWTAPATGNGPVTFYACFSSSKTNAKKCTYTISESTIGLDENSDSEAIAIYPNPASNMLTVVIPEYANTDLSIYNLAGQLLFGETLCQGISEINISNLEKGIYILKTVSSENTIISRFIKE